MTTALSTADRLAREASSHVRISPMVAVQVARYETAAIRYRQLGQLNAAHVTPAEWRAFTAASRIMATSRAVLAASGQLHLIEVGR